MPVVLMEHLRRAPLSRLQFVVLPQVQRQIAVRVARVECHVPNWIARISVDEDGLREQRRDSVGHPVVGRLVNAHVLTMGAVADAHHLRGHRLQVKQQWLGLSHGNPRAHDPLFQHFGGSVIVVASAKPGPVHPAGPEPLVLREHVRAIHDHVLEGVTLKDHIPGIRHHDLVIHMRPRVQICEIHDVPLTRQRKLPPSNPDLQKGVDLQGDIARKFRQVG
mmetsp:Transcript_84617/g.141502  ORF Transcript_84617/g.141502 Transcript_84617/m.141502 type:complete len:220 (-) Transcript_84617:531-1190(-)